MASSLTDAVLALLDKESPHALDTLARLVSVDTCFPPGRGYAQWAGLLDDLLAPLGFATERVTVPEPLWASPGVEGDRINVIARRGNSRSPVSIYFHSDTAPVAEGWTRPALELTVEGSADMKGTIVSVLCAIPALDEAGAPYAYDPVLLFCTDEEGGLYRGVRYLAEQGLIEGHVLCLNGQAEPRIWGGCFGSVDLWNVLRGRAAHAGAPAGGVNAVEEALPVLSALRSLGGTVSKRTSALVGRDGAPLRSRLSITAAHGGVKGSALPAALEVIVNRRYAPEEHFGAVVAEIRETVEATVAGTALQ